MSLTFSMRPSENWATSTLESEQWIPLIRDFDATAWSGPEEFAAFCGTFLTMNLPPDEAEQLPALRDRAVATVLDCYTHLVGVVPAHLHFLYWPDVHRAPLPVFVGLWLAEHDRESALNHYSGALAEGALEPPIVEEFATEHLGAGLRVLRFDRWEEPAPDERPGAEPDIVRTTVAYAWRSAAYQTDVQVWATTQDAGQLIAALPELDAFARAIVPTPDPGT